MNMRNRSTVLIETLLTRRVLVLLTLVLAYGCGFWLWMLHEVEGAIEPNEPPGVIHWLRDSSLSLPLVALGVFFGSLMAKNLLRRYGPQASPFVVAAVITVVMAMYASVALSVGNPIHGYLFEGQVHGGGHDLPFAVHVVRDGLLALSANELLVAAIFVGVLGRRWLAAGRGSDTRDVAYAAS
jgi:hypothetical protein